MTRRNSFTMIVAGAAMALLVLGAASPAVAQDPPGIRSVLITHARVFDGRSERLSAPTSVLIQGDRIARLGAELPVPEGAEVIDAQGRVMTPGFIAAHEHLMLQISFLEGVSSDEFYQAYVATGTARSYLMHGFTSVRDVAGNSYSLKKAIDRGILVGPRIYPSGPMISQTAGHSDLRFDSHKSRLIGGEDSVLVQYGHLAVADGVPNVLTAVRENLRRGASQIKIAVGGGTGSFADPLDVVQYTPEEIRAAVQAAADWGTYVMAHVYNNEGIRRAIDNGVQSIEHANLIDEPTLQLMKEKGIWLSPQVITYTVHPRGYTEDQKKKHDQALAGIDEMFRNAKKVGFDRIAFGSDIITDPAMIERMNDEFTLRSKWFTPVEILRQATSISAQMLALSGRRNPYPGQLGVIEEGAYADLLLVDGNPLEDISVLAKPEQNLVLIMKGGKIYKNTIQ